MTRGCWVPPASELAIGLEFYATSTAPVKAAVKVHPADFQVTEISLYPRPDPEGRFTVLRVVSEDWEQHLLARTLEERLRLPPRSVRWAGTKDRRSVAERLFSYRGPLPESMPEIPRVSIREVYRAREGLSLGHHFGNTFRVRLAELDPVADQALERFGRTREQIGALGGVPNLFGPQRFGEVRPVTHLVGQALVTHGAEAAVHAYLTIEPPSGESFGREARLAYANHQDPRRALREFPESFVFERALLSELARGHSPERALRALSRELRLLFVHAFQSWLFNRWLSARWDRELSLVEPLEGDHLLRSTRDGQFLSRGLIPVDSDNLAEAREMARSRQASLAGPLIGFATPPASGEVGNLTEELLEQEGIGRDGFRLPHTPELASAGAWRPLVAPTTTIRMSAGSPRAEADVWFEFALPKGSYATVVLREFLKSGSTAA